jgi:WD40 repeat protein
LRRSRALAIVGRVARLGRTALLLAAAAAAVAVAAIYALGGSEPTPTAAAPPAVPRERAVLAARASAAAISPDGRRCVTLDRGGTASLWSCADGTRLGRRAGLAPAAGPAVAFTRDGIGVLATGGAVARELDPTDLRNIAQVRGRSEALAPVISPSADRAFRPRSRHVAEIVDTKTGSEVAAVHHVPDLARARVVFSRDDSSFAVILRPRSWVNVFNAASGELINFFGLEAGRADVDLSSDGARVLIANGPTVRIMDVITGVELQRFTAPDATSTAAFGADERLVVAGDVDGRVRVWDTASGAEVAEYAGHPGPVADAALAADGRLLVTGPSRAPVVLECPACAPAA